MKKIITIAILALSIGATAQIQTVYDSQIIQSKTSGGNAGLIIDNSFGSNGIISTNNTGATVFKVDRNGTLSATTANFAGAGVGAGLVGVGAGNKIVLNGNNGNATISGVSLLFGGAYVGPRADDSSQPALTVNGQGAFKGISNAGQKITGVGNGTDATDAVNKGQLDAVQGNLNTQVERLDDRIDTKADKVQVAQDIQHARQQAIRISNEYTDEKISEVNYKVDTEVKRLDDKLDLEIEANRMAQKRLDDKINSNDEKINQRVRDLEIKIDNRFNAVMSYVGNEFAAVNNRIEGLGAMTVALSAAATSSVYNANKPTNLNIATGLYGRATAIAVGMSHFFNSSTKVSVNYSKGSNTKNAVGIGAGFAF